jgi:hypothetical protein
MRAHRSAVVPADRADIPHLAALATAYTWDSPAAAWLVPAVQQRPCVLLAWYCIVIEHALRHGHVDLTTDRQGAAIWVDGTRPITSSQEQLRRLTSSCGRYAVAILQYQQLLSRHRSTSAHLHLIALAGDPVVSAQLLARRHHANDRSGLPAYTVVSDNEHAAVLSAAGYRPTNPCRLPDGTQLRIMLRPAAIGTVTPLARMPALRAA